MYFNVHSREETRIKEKCFYEQLDDICIRMAVTSTTTFSITCQIGVTSMVLSTMNMDAERCDVVFSYESHSFLQHIDGHIRVMATVVLSC